MALLKLENLHVALEDGTEIVKGVDLEVDMNEVHAVMGPNGSGKIDPRVRADGPPGLRDHRGTAPLRRRRRDGARRRRARAARPLPRLPVSARDSRRHRDELPAQRDQRRAQGPERRRRRPDRDPRVPQGAPRPDGPPQGQPRARVALPQRRLLGRREEAGRDPADGDAEAAHRGARRDRLRPRHRRAARRGERRERARRPRDGRARDHALPADPRLRHSRSRPRLRGRAYRGVGRPGARQEAREGRLRRPTSREEVPA